MGKFWILFVCIMLFGTLLAGPIRERTRSTTTRKPVAPSALTTAAPRSSTALISTQHLETTTAASRCGRPPKRVGPPTTTTHYTQKRTKSEKSGWGGRPKKGDRPIEERATEKAVEKKQTSTTRKPPTERGPIVVRHRNVATTRDTGFGRVLEKVGALRGIHEEVRKPGPKPKTAQEKEEEKKKKEDLKKKRTGCPPKCQNVEVPKKTQAEKVPKKKIAKIQPNGETAKTILDTLEKIKQEKDRDEKEMGPFTDHCNRILKDIIVPGALRRSSTELLIYIYYSIE